MPRGGRRPGAGARKGNTNAMTSMNHSLRARIAYELLLLHPDKRMLAHLLVDNGVPLGRRQLTRRHYRRAVEIVYHHFFDRSETEQSTTIKQDHPSTPKTTTDPGTTS